jgi:hypothetical protein
MAGKVLGKGMFMILDGREGFGERHVHDLGWQGRFWGKACS